MRGVVAPCYRETQPATRTASTYALKAREAPPNVPRSPAAPTEEDLRGSSLPSSAPPAIPQTWSSGRRSHRLKSLNPRGRRRRMGPRASRRRRRTRMLAASPGTGRLGPASALLRISCCATIRASTEAAGARAHRGGGASQVRSRRGRQDWGRPSRRLLACRLRLDHVGPNDRGGRPGRRDPRRAEGFRRRASRW